MGSSGTGDRAEELGRQAARLLRRSRPVMEKAVAEVRPRVEKAARDALRYAQAHEDDIKRTALKAARLKVRGPFGFVVDAMSGGMGAKAGPAAKVCGGCNAANAAGARFCAQCGTKLGESES